MRSSKLFLALLITIITVYAVAANAASIDMDDPRRALGRVNDVRIDAQLMRDTVSPGAPIGITYQVQNFTNEQVAVATKLAVASYDEDSRTITIAIGSEVPPDGNMPSMVLIGPGEKKVFRSAATPSFGAATLRGSFATTPRFVQLKVAVMRNVAPFRTLIDAGTTQRLTDAQFEQWFESNDTILLNALPVQYSPERVTAGADGRRGAGGAF